MGKEHEDHESPQKVDRVSKLLLGIATLLVSGAAITLIFNINVMQVWNTFINNYQTTETPTPAESIFQATQNAITLTEIAVQATQTAIAIQPTTIIGSTPFSPTSSTDTCTGALDNNQRSVPAGTVVLGDVTVNGERQYDLNATDAAYNFPEGTTVYYEVDGTVTAPFGATCFHADDLEAMWSLMEFDYEGGCATGCKTERIVIVRDTGVEVYYYPDEVSSLSDLADRMNGSTTSQTSFQIAQVCPPNGVIRTGMGAEATLNINVPDGYVQYLGGTRFDDTSDGVLVKITGPYTGQHRLFQGAFCDPVEAGSPEDAAAENQIRQEIASGGVICPTDCPIEIQILISVKGVDTPLFCFTPYSNPSLYLSTYHTHPADAPSSRDPRHRL